MIFIGSSKGGYSALNFAFLYDNSYAVIAAPQYLLGNYLNCDIMKPQLEDILGTVTASGIESLNTRLRDRIISRNTALHQYVYIHYSKNEHTYSEHIQYLLEDLKKSNVPIYEDVQTYVEHGDLYKYYPSYLVSTVKQIID